MSKCGATSSSIIDLAICDSCGRESTMTLCSEVKHSKSFAPSRYSPISSSSACLAHRTPHSCLVSRSFRMPDSAAGWLRTMRRATCAWVLTARYLQISSSQICITVEKKITVPVQLCVLSTGFAEAPLQENVSGVVTCPGLFPERNDSSAAAFGLRVSRAAALRTRGAISTALRHLETATAAAVITRRRHAAECRMHTR